MFVASGYSADQINLTIDVALALFYQRSLDIIASRYAIDSARAEELVAAALPNPTISVNLTELTPNNSANGRSNLGPYYGFMIDQLIITAGKRATNIESSQIATQASEEDLRNTIRLLSNLVRHTFYNLLLAQKATELAEENRNRFVELRRVSALRLRQGDIAEKDLLRIDVEMLRAESDLNQSVAAETAARAELAKLLAWPDDAMTIEASDGWPIPSFSDPLSDENALVERARKTRPDIAAARAQVEKADRDLILARKLAVPDVNVGLGYAHDPQNLQSDYAQLQISVPLPIFYRQEGEIGKAAVNLNSARLNLLQLEQTVRAEVVAGIAKWQAALQISKRFESQILDKAKQIRNTAEFSYNKGATDIIDLIEAERTYKSVTLDYISALNSRTLAYADLQTALGN